MEFSKIKLPEELHNQLKDYVYPIIGIMQYVHNDLGPGLPEYVYQEALKIKFQNKGIDTIKEYQHHPTFDGIELNSSVKMDLLLSMSRGNVIIECKSIKELTERERYQLSGYLRSTEFPIGILVNFGTWPKAQIERYYYKKGIITPF